MNNQCELIFQKALQSVNPKAIFHVAEVLRDIGETNKADILQQHLSTGFGIDVPPVPMPTGYRRANAKEITKPVLTFARKALQHALPVGKQQTAVITNAKDKSKHTFLALTEHHLDNHPARPSQGYKAGEGPEFLHPGISILISTQDSFAGFGADIKPGGMSAAEEEAYRKALWGPNYTVAAIGSIATLSALALFLVKKRLGLH